MRKKENKTETGERTEKEVIRYVFQLFITGANANSIRAVVNMRQICEEHLKGIYSLEIIDVYQQQSLAEQQQLIALPLLVRKQPLPECRLIGDLSDTQKVLKGIGLIQ